MCAALPRLTKGRAYVSPANCGWVTVYSEDTESQDDGIMRDIAGGLSKVLTTVVLGFLVHDSDVVMYWLYRDGALADEFNCAPDYFGEHVSERTRARVQGNTDILLPLTEIGVGAAVYGLEGFVAALLEGGLNPNSPNAQGRTTLQAAEQHGQGSAIYRLVKAAAERGEVRD